MGINRLSSSSNWVFGYTLIERKNKSRCPQLKLSLMVIGRKIFPGNLNPRNRMGKASSPEYRISVLLKGKFLFKIAVK